MQTPAEVQAAQTCIKIICETKAEEWTKKIRNEGLQDLKALLCDDCSLAML